MKTLLIGLAGQMGCGKSAVAEHLHSTLGFHPPLAFADPLKDMIGAMLEVEHAELERLKRSNEPLLDGVTARRLLQTLGTEWGRRTVHPDLWLLLMARKLKKIAEWQHHVTGVVISDVRFENEVAFIRARGGVVVHIYRPDAPLDTNPPHLSEQGVQFHPDDMTLDNTSTLGTLYFRTEQLVARLRGFVEPPRIARAS